MQAAAAARRPTPPPPPARRRKRPRSRRPSAVAARTDRAYAPPRKRGRVGATLLGAQRLSGHAVGSYAYATPAHTQLAHRTLPLSAYVHALAHHLPPPLTLPRLVQSVRALFDPAAALPTEPLARLHDYVHRRLPASDPLRGALEAELQAYAQLPPQHPLVPRKRGRWVHAVRQPAAERGPRARVLRVPPAEATGAYASLAQITSPFRALAARVAWHVSADAQHMELHTDADAWEAVDALQLMHAHRAARAPRFPRLLRHWFAPTGDATVDRVRRVAVRRVLLSWVDPNAAQYELHELPLEPHAASAPPEPAAAAVLDQLFGFLADAWDSVGALAADLYPLGDGPGVVEVVRTLLLLAARHVAFEVERTTLAWLVDVALARQPVADVRALHGEAYTYVRHLWLAEEGAVPVRDWLRFEARAPVCAFLAFARSPLLTPAERRRVLHAVRVAGAETPAPPRARELYAPRSEWRAWSYTAHVLADPRVAPPAAPVAHTLDSDGEAQLVLAGALLPMLEYSLYYRCTPGDPARLLASLAEHGFEAVDPAAFLDRDQHWAVTADAAAGDAVRYDHEVLLQLYDAPPAATGDDARGPGSRQAIVHGIVQHWGVAAYRRFRDAATARLQTVGDALAAAQGTPLAQNGAFWKALRHAAGPNGGRVAVLANAHLPDDFHFAKGVAVDLPADAPLPLELLNHARAASVVATAPLPANVRATPQDLARVRAVLAKRAAAAPLRLGALATDFDDPAARDHAHWEPALGARGVLAVCRTKRVDEFGIGEDAGHDYHLVYAGGPEGLLDEVYAQLRAQAPAARPTVGAFVEGPVWRAVMRAAERNARGVLAVAAEELGAPLATEPDAQSCYADQADVQAPALAVTSHLQHNGGFEVRANGARITALAGATSTRRAHQGRLLLALGPLHGFAAYPVRADADRLWPVGPARASSRAHGSARIALPEVVGRLYGGSEDAPADHPRLQPELYTAPDRAFHQALDAHGWDRAAGRQHYELVAATVHVDRPASATADKPRSAVPEPLPLADLGATVRAGSVSA